MKKKILKVLLFAIEAIPIPISVVSWIGTLIIIAGGIGTVNWSNFSNAIGAIIMIMFFVFVGIYPITYIVSLLKVKDKNEFSIWIFLPIIHILAVIIFVIFLTKK